MLTRVLITNSVDELERWFPNQL